MCIKIPVEESSFDVTVRHISSLTSFSFISVKGESGYFRFYCLLANVIGTFRKNLGQPYVRLTSKSNIRRKEAMLS